MAKSTEPQLNLNTPDNDLGKVEIYKQNANMARGHLAEHLSDLSVDDVIDESEQLAKSHGIYLEYNRAKTGREKDWMFMVRISIPGGGPLDKRQWAILDDLADRYAVNPDGVAGLRLTTRQNIQFHWVKKKNIIDLVRGVAATGFFTLNGCGDNVRNIMACPLSGFSTIFDGNALAHELAEYFRLPAEPHIEIFGIDPSYIRTPDNHFQYGAKLMNRKFKIGIGAVHRDVHSGQWVADNCAEIRTNDVGIAPIVEDDRVSRFMIYVGGGQGEKNGKPTFAALGKPFGVVSRDNLVAVLDAIASVQQEIGDRSNRNAARMKYIINKMGVAWFQDQVRARGVEFEPPIEDFDYGDRHLHHGWNVQPSDGNLAYGAYIENGRLMDGPNGRLKTMVKSLLDEFDCQAMPTPNQDLIFTGIDPARKTDFEAAMSRFGYGERKGKPYSQLRKKSGACVGLYTCRLSYTESEQFEPVLMDELEAMGYGDMTESIGITGCERQCFRPSTKTIGWVGQGKNLYALRLGGSESGRYQGIQLVVDGKWYMRQVPRDLVATVTGVLFDFYLANKQSDEDMGAFHRRIGARAILENLAANAKVAHLTEKSYDSPYIPEGGKIV